MTQKFATHLAYYITYAQNFHYNTTFIFLWLTRLYPLIWTYLSVIMFFNLKGFKRVQIKIAFFASMWYNMKDYNSHLVWQKEIL